MLKHARRDLITETLRRDGRVLASEIAGRIGVSDDTVRRDLGEMADEGLLQRVHGGALPVSPALAPFTVREQQAPEAKRAIARAAAALVKPRQAVFLDAGTTARLVARYLPVDLEATIVTHSPNTAEVLTDHPRVDVVLLGGRILKLSRVAVGSSTVDAVRAIRADLYFLGVNGLHADVGITTHDPDEAHVKRAMIESAADTVALVSSEKLGTAGRYVVAPATELTHLVTEEAAPRELVAPFERLGITIIRA